MGENSVANVSDVFGVFFLELTRCSETCAKLLTLTSDIKVTDKIHFTFGLERYSYWEGTVFLSSVTSRYRILQSINHNFLERVMIMRVCVHHFNIVTLLYFNV